MDSAGERYVAGDKARRDVLGDEYVDGTSKPTSFTEEFQKLVTEYCWGTIWTDERLDRRTHSILNLGMTAALGRMDEFALHFRGARRNGVTDEQLKAALMQIAVYCGIPAGVSCFRIGQKIIDEGVSVPQDGHGESPELSQNGQGGR